jgi:hypothetical protein
LSGYQQHQPGRTINKFGSHAERGAAWRVCSL